MLLTSLHSCDAFRLSEGKCTLAALTHVWKKSTTYSFSPGWSDFKQAHQLELECGEAGDNLAVLLTLGQRMALRVLIRR